MKQEPIFKKKEIVIQYPDRDGLVDIGGGGEYMTGKVLYVGEQQEYYKPGQIVLYRWAAGFKDKPSKLDYFEKPLLRFEMENQIVCEITTNESI